MRRIYGPFCWGIALWDHLKHFCQSPAKHLGCLQGRGEDVIPFVDNTGICNALVQGSNVWSDTCSGSTSCRVFVEYVLAHLKNLRLLWCGKRVVCQTCMYSKYCRSAYVFQGLGTRPNCANERSSSQAAGLRRSLGARWCVWCCCVGPGQVAPRPSPNPDPASSCGAGLQVLQPRKENILKTF